MKLKSLLIYGWTFLVALIVLVMQVQSFSIPQVQKDLNFLRLDFTLQASWLAQDSEDFKEPVLALALSLMGKESLAKAPEEAEKTYAKVYENLVTPAPVLEGQTKEEATKLIETQKVAKAKLEIRLGLLKAETGNVQGAINLWQEASQTAQTALSAKVLRGLYSSPAQIYSESEQVLANELKGWYRDKSLVQLYTLQSRDQALANLQGEIQTKAEEQLKRLALIILLPLLCTMLGLGLLIREGFLWLRKQLPQTTWCVPWELETTCLIITGWITLYNLLGLLVSQEVQLLAASQNLPKDTTIALASFISYSTGTLVGLLLINFLIWKPYGKLQEFFRMDIRAVPAGFAAYFAAVPLFTSALVLNEKLFPQGGGGNPTLTIITGSENIEAKVLLFSIAVVLAPVFEEILFRGMLYPALASRLSPWFAIPLTSLIFAACHYSVVELLPLTILSVVITYTYHRTQNLVPSIVLHSLFNGWSFLTLLVLGSSN